MRLVLECVLCFIFLISGLLKAIDFGNTQLDIRSYNLIPYRLSLWAGIMLILSEIALVAMYSFSLFPLFRDAAAILLLIVFSLALMHKRKQSQAATCSCFGNLNWMNRYPIRRNILLMGIILLVWILPQRSVDHSMSVMLSVGLLIAAGWITLLHLFRRKQRRNIENKLIDELWPEWSKRTRAENDAFPLLLLNPEVPDWPAMDELLSKPCNKSIVVALEAPSWLVRAKTLSWKSHQVVEINKSGSFQPDGRVLLVSDKKIKQEYSSSLQWIKETMNKKKTFSMK